MNGVPHPATIRDCLQRVPERLQVRFNEVRSAKFRVEAHAILRCSWQPMNKPSCASQHVNW